MGNRICCKSRKNKQRQFPILLIGLSSVGKTYIGHFLSKQHRTDFSATNGCAAYKFIYNNNIVRLTEIGGSNDIRDIWHVYFKNSMGIIFVIDSINIEELQIARDELYKLMCHPDVIGKPILILATKQDLNNAINIIDLTEWLQIEMIVNRLQSPCYIESCGFSNQDGICDGFKWMISMITLNYTIYKNRIKFSNSNSFRRQRMLNYRPKTAHLSIKKQNNDERPRSTPALKTRTNVNENNKIRNNQISPVVSLNNHKGILIN